MEKYGVSLLIQSKCGKILTIINSEYGHFSRSYHCVIYSFDFFSYWKETQNCKFVLRVTFSFLSCKRVPTNRTYLHMLILVCNSIAVVKTKPKLNKCKYINIKIYKEFFEQTHHLPYLILLNKGQVAHAV